ncbi:protein of unknown function [Candidatus Methylocalor cossyra]|uniref:Uncharacterized protein n=1 Tax=Candidatus Methylocalor cossyra TaxID=3108543 RepID=A0ABP1C7C3_9GAMM
MIHAKNDGPLTPGPMPASACLPPEVRRNRLRLQPGCNRERLHET